MNSTKDYILGTHHEELERLGFQHRVWADAAHNLWQKAGFKGGDHLLDLGCGPGFATFDMAELVQSQGSVVGIDVAQNYIKFATHKANAIGLKQASFIAADFDQMQLSPNALDGVYARWVFSWINNTETVLQKIAAALKPGAKFAAQEYIHWGTLNIIPEHPHVRTMIEACRESWRRMDSEIDVGKTIIQQCENAGLRVIHIAPLERTAMSNSLTWQWPTQFMRIYAKQLIAMGLINQKQLDNYLDAINSVANSPGAFLVTPLMIEFIAEKPR